MPWLALAVAFTIGGGSLIGMGMAMMGLVALFGCVLLHELGHSRVAQHFGIRVSSISLSPIGGVAWMEGIPEDPKIEGLIAIAGPSVNFVLSALAAPFLFVPAVAPIAWFFISVNLLLGTFNLVPAFPMDGGRVLRALLALKYDWLKATEKAVRIGFYLAIFGGLFLLSRGFWLAPVIAIYIIFMGQRELFMMRARKLGQDGFGFSAFADAARRAGAQYSQGQGPAGFGFQTPGGAFADEEPQVEAQSTASRPGGFSEEDISKLENMRGRLSRDWREED